MRRLLFTLLLFTAASRQALAEVTFVSPLQGAQVMGPELLEVRLTQQDIDRVDFLVDGVLVGVARRSPWRIRHDFGDSTSSHEIRATVWFDHFGKQESAAISTASLSAGETVNVDFVEVPLRIRAGSLVRSVDLEVRENGVEQSIRDLRQTRQPARFVFLIDRSLSMGDGKLIAALHAVDNVRSALLAGDHAEIVLFNHRVARAQPLPREARAAGLFADVTPSGGTSLRDALASVGGTERTYVIVISDGTDRDSVTSREEALRQVSGTHSVIEALTFGRDSDFLADAAGNTGGTVRKTTRQTIVRDLRNLLDDINSRYTLSYQSHGNASGWRSITITARRRGIAIANARKGYFAR